MATVFYVIGLLFSAGQAAYSIVTSLFGSAVAGRLKGLVEQIKDISNKTGTPVKSLLNKLSSMNSAQLSNYFSRNPVLGRTLDQILKDQNVLTSLNNKLDQLQSELAAVQEKASYAQQRANTISGANAAAEDLKQYEAEAAKIKDQMQQLQGEVDNYSKEQQNQNLSGVSNAAVIQNIQGGSR